MDYDETKNRYESGYKRGIFDTMGIEFLSYCTCIVAVWRMSRKYGTAIP